MPERRADEREPDGRTQRKHRFMERAAKLGWRVLFVRDLIGTIAAALRVFLGR